MLDLILAESFKFFEKLHLDHSWLAESFIRTVKVTKNFANILTKDDGVRLFIYQGVGRNRRMIPNFKLYVLNG